jgi:predicted nucleic acid-binding Zn ribbon protein
MCEIETCPLEYRIIDPNHSYCSQPFPSVVEQRVTSSEQEYILEIHNYERRRTHGTNMQKMVKFLFSLIFIIYIVE